MKTAVEMLAYAKKNNLIGMDSYKESKNLERFAIIESMLASEEEVMLSAISYQCDTITGGVAVAITNERIIIVKKGFFETPKVVWSLDSIENIDMAPGKNYSGGAIILVPKSSEYRHTYIYFSDIDEKFQKFNKVFKECKGIGAAPVSEADELKKFKELLDAGIITEEEFTAKKKQMFGF